MIQLSGGVARNPLVRLATPIDTAIGSGEHIAIIGSNASGKSILVDTLIGKYPLKEGQATYDFTPSVSETVYENVKYIAFRDTYGAADAQYFYQQRWNSSGQDDTPTVREWLGEIHDEALCRQLFQLFDIARLIDQKIILLSSGELRKFQLIKALLTAPRVLIIDNPFIGLDVEARQLLQFLLQELSTLEHLQLILVLSIPADIPDFITHVIPVQNKQVLPKMERSVYLSINHTVEEPLGIADIQQRVLELPYREDDYASDEVVRLRKVSIRYDDRTILRELDWTVRRGEKWALKGANGAGKSTLLSLICADNPQAYACDISLFGRKRGTGESIWEIKKHIGYVSPEMHRGYMKNIPVIDIVASGLHDSVGLYKRPQPEQYAICEWWMHIFGIEALKNQSFLYLSSGEQRLVLLARAFVKDPELLILDEPLHGLDADNRLLVKRIIEAFCRRRNKTLIMVTHYEEELPDAISHQLTLLRTV